jgi:hypothetical protein
MEITELISYNINYGKDTIEIKFRMNEDDEHEIRLDEINLTEADDFGYTLIYEDFDFYDEDEDSDELETTDDVDEHELLSFLNEYYMIYPERLPEKDIL